MKPNFKTWLLGFIPSALFFWLLLCTGSTPYQHKWYLPHRWLSEAIREPQQMKAYNKCMKEFQSHSNQAFASNNCFDPREAKFLKASMPDGTTYYFDLCLTHGEIRRLK